MSRGVTMQLEPISRVSVSDEIIDLIKKQIMEGTLRPGNRLPSEEKMAEQLRVGRGTVREALKVLIYMGIIERKNKTAVVSHSIRGKVFPDQIIRRMKQCKNIMEMIEARLIIEPGIARTAAIKAQKSDIEILTQFCERMENNKEDAEQFVSYNNQFHHHLVHSTGNQIMIDVSHGIQDLMRRNQEFFVRNSHKIKDRSILFHRNILSAIVEGDPDKAEREMIAHLKDVEKEMYLIIREEP
jgi:GntR family transcriptional repressor for pyruvate dehydrogenase complex